ncbi:MAG: zf-HC2 domain-containing protein [Gemmatimonadetes bacterium]|nr:zf-HC2 domain-containing protein [Gemmatimonadota bacterium]
MADGTTGPGSPDIMQQRRAGIRCIEVLRGLSEYLDGELSEELRLAINQHLEVCDQCEDFGLHFTKTIQALRREMASARPVDDDVASRLRATVTAALGEIETRGGGLEPL